MLSRCNVHFVMPHWVRHLVAFGLALSLFGAGAAYGKKKKLKTLPPPPTDLPGHVNYLARRLYGVPLDESEPITSQIQKLVIDDLDQWLANRTPSGQGSVSFDVQVRREMENAFSKLHYPLFGEPVVFTRPWKDSALIGAGYTLGWTDYDRVNVIALYASRQGKTQRVALDSFVPHTDLHYGFVTAPTPDSFWFIVYGSRLGKSDPRLTAILYSFDGHSLKSLWEARDAYGGKIEVDPDRVVIRHLKEEEVVRAIEERRRSGPPHYEAVYRVTPKGLELETDYEVQ